MPKKTGKPANQENNAGLSEADIAKGPLVIDLQVVGNDPKQKIKKLRMPGSCFGARIH